MWKKRKGFFSRLVEGLDQDQRRTSCLELIQYFQRIFRH